MMKILEISFAAKDAKKQMAKDIHQSLMNIRTKIGEDTTEDYFKRLNSFMSLLPSAHFSDQDRLDVIDEILALDKKSYTTIKQSVFVDVWKHHQDGKTEESRRLMDILERSQDPATQKFVKALKEGKL